MVTGRAALRANATARHSRQNIRATRLVGIAGVIVVIMGAASSTLRSTPTSITRRRRADTIRTHGLLRAIYFNHDVYIGFVQGSHVLEVAAVDPTSSAVFYTLSQEPRARPTFSRETTTCLMCHQSRAATGGVPGFIVLSTLADRYGYPITGVHDGTTTDWTPIAERFGGWYVTGTHGTTGHSGNVYSPMLGHELSDKRAYRLQFKFQSESARTDLSGKPDATPYLSAHCDIVALMVLVHQTGVHNLITAVHEAAKEALLDRSLSIESTLPIAAIDSTVISNVHLRSAVERLARSMRGDVH